MLHPSCCSYNQGVWSYSVGHMTEILNNGLPLGYGVPIRSHVYSSVEVVGLCLPQWTFFTVVLLLVRPVVFERKLFHICACHVLFYVDLRLSFTIVELLTIAKI